MPTLIARFMAPTWGPSGADRTQVGAMLAPELCYPGVRLTMLVKAARVVQLRWYQKAVMLAIFSSLAAQEVVIQTTSGTASDDKVIKMTTFWFQCIKHT